MIKCLLIKYYTKRNDYSIEIYSSRFIYIYIYKEGNALFNDALNTLYLLLYGVGHMVKDHPDSHMGYSFRLAAMVLLYASSHRQGNTFHGLCYTSRGALAATRNSSMGPPWRIDPTTHRNMSERSYNGATSRSATHTHTHTHTDINMY